MCMIMWLQPVERERGREQEREREGGEEGDQPFELHILFHLPRACGEFDRTWIWTCYLYTTVAYSLAIEIKKKIFQYMFLYDFFPTNYAKFFN